MFSKVVYVFLVLYTEVISTTELEESPDFSDLGSGFLDFVRVAFEDHVNHLFFTEFSKKLANLGKLTLF